jgi:hypothetical protein
MEPQKEVRYLGVDIDLEHFTYSTLQVKRESARQLMRELIQAGQEKSPVSCRQVARMLGKIAAMKMLHGNIVAIATRNIQHHLGLTVVKEGWEAQLLLNKQDIAEIEWFCTNEQRFNGRGIRDETGPEIVFRRQHVERATAGEEGLGENRPESQGIAWMVSENEKITELEEFPGGTSETAVDEGVRQLRAIRRALSQRASAHKGDRWTRMVWETSSQNCYKFLRKGAREQDINNMVIQVKWEEIRTKIEVMLVSVASSPVDIAIADARSRQTASTDEWGVRPEELTNIFRKFQVEPTIDAFASSSNA